MINVICIINKHQGRFKARTARGAGALVPLAASGVWHASGHGKGSGGHWAAQGGNANSRLVVGIRRMELRCCEAVTL